MELGGIEHKETAIRNFNAIFNRMGDLLKKARGVEFRLKIYFDIKEHTSHLTDKDYKKFSNSGFVAAKPKIDKLIKKIAEPEKERKLQDIRMFLEPLAHADYIKARKYIDAYNKKYVVDAMLHNKPFPERCVDNIKDENGDAKTYGHLMFSSEKNLIISEFLIFEYQGYSAFVDKVIEEEVLCEFNLDESAWLYEILMIAHSIKKDNKAE